MKVFVKRLAACAAAALMAMSMALPASAAGSYDRDLTIPYNIYNLHGPTIRYFYEPGTTDFWDDVVASTHCSSVVSNPNNLAKVTVHVGDIEKTKFSTSPNSSGDMKSGNAVVDGFDYASKVVHIACRNGGPRYTDMFV